jgi:meromycolic acid (3R)-3-hydroxyacyl-[acyl-carrier protein] dehydratase HadC
MALKTDIRGMVHVYPDHFVVGREKVREYAAAVKAEDLASVDEKPAAELGHAAIVAPLTFTSVFALLVQQDFFRSVDVGIETMHIVQVDQRFVYHKPIHAGDKLWARLEIHSVDERFGADIVVTKNICTDENGETVLEAFTTLMGQEADSSVNIGGI